MKTIKKHSVVPIYLVGLVWLGYSLLFPLYRIMDFVLCGAASLVVFSLERPFSARG